MSGQRILITGGSGCVGRYIVDELLAHSDHALLLLAREPRRLPPDVRDHPRVTILHGTLDAAPDRFAQALGSVDEAILAAAEWGPDPQARDINVTATLALAHHLATGACRHIIHFATASVLDHDHSPLPQAEHLGTPYIRSKAECARALRHGVLGVPLTVVYPTLVVGGGERGIPRSHFSGLLAEVARRRHFVRFVQATGTFHAIHAADIARIVARLVDEHPSEPVRELVLGGAAVTVNEAVDALCRALAVRRVRLLQLSPAVVQACIRLFHIQLATWDRFCLDRAHFTHRQTTMPGDVGARAAYPTFSSLVAFALRDGDRASAGFGGPRLLG